MNGFFLGVFWTFYLFYFHSFSFIFIFSLFFWILSHNPQEKEGEKRHFSIILINFCFYYQLLLLFF